MEVNFDVEKINSQIPSEVIEILKLINKSNEKIFLVGGCVRDMLIGEVPHDFDMCTSMQPLEVVNLFEKNGFFINPKGLDFGTVTVYKEGFSEEYEITTFRKDVFEESLDHRHPSHIEYVNDVVYDLSRRDFTINAMAYDPLNNLLVDPFGGKKDLEKELIRAVGNPEERFQEDALRILRALRFSIKFGFDLDEKTFECMNKWKDGLEEISKERISMEIYKILTCNKPISPIFQKANEIVFKIIPELKEGYKFNQNNKYHKHDVYEHNLAVVDLCDTNDFEVKFAALLHDIGKPRVYSEDENGNGHFYGHPEVSYEITKKLLDENFRFTTKQNEMILELVRHHDDKITPSKKNIKRFLSKHLMPNFFDKWLVLKNGDILDHKFIIPIDDPKFPIWGRLDKIIELYKEIESENSCFTRKNLAINGNDVREIVGVKNQEVGRILQEILDKVIDEEIPNDRNELLSYLKTLQRDNKITSFVENDRKQQNIIE